MISSSDMPSNGQRPGTGADDSAESSSPSTGKHVGAVLPMRPLPCPGHPRFRDSIDHLVQVGGEDVVALGSDYDGIACTLRGLEHVSAIDAIERALDAAGVAGARIAKIMGGNARRVIEAVLA